MGREEKERYCTVYLFLEDIQITKRGTKHLTNWTRLIDLNPSWSSRALADGKVESQEV